MAEKYNVTDHCIAPVKVATTVRLDYAFNPLQVLTGLPGR